MRPSTRETMRSASSSTSSTSEESRTPALPSRASRRRVAPISRRAPMSTPPDGSAGGAAPRPAGEPAKGGADLPAGADVDAPERLVEQGHLRAGAEPAADDHLLLVAAGEVV